MKSETKKQNAFFEARDSLRGFIVEAIREGVAEDEIVRSAVDHAMPIRYDDMAEVIAESFNGFPTDKHVQGSLGDVLADLCSEVLWGEAQEIYEEVKS